MKPGYLTTEFWTVLISYVLGFFVFTGHINQQQVNDITPAVGQIVTSAIVIITSVTYIWSRTKIKQADIASPFTETTETVEETPTVAV